MTKTYYDVVLLERGEHPCNGNVVVTWATDKPVSVRSPLSDIQIVDGCLLLQGSDGVVYAAGAWLSLRKQLHD